MLLEGKNLNQIFIYLLAILILNACSWYTGEEAKQEKTAYFEWTTFPDSICIPANYSYSLTNTYLSSSCEQDSIDRWIPQFSPKFHSKGHVGLSTLHTCTCPNTTNFPCAPTILYLLFTSHKSKVFYCYWYKSNIFLFNVIIILSCRIASVFLFNIWRQI